MAAKQNPATAEPVAAETPEPVALPPRIAPPTTAGERPNLAGYVDKHVVLAAATAVFKTRTTKKGEEVETAASSVTIYDGSKSETLSGLDSLRLARQIRTLNEFGNLPTVVRVVKHGRGSSTAFAPWDDEAVTGSLWSAYLETTTPATESEGEQA
jgi:hypothetical protein